MQKHVDEKIEYNRSRIAGLLAENAGLEKQKRESALKKGIKKWIGNNFESSSGLTREFADFAREYHRELKKALAPSYIITGWSRGHFYLSAFVKDIKTGKLVYISTSDVRGGHSGWYNSILMRTAKHERDWTGGSNHFTTWPKIKEDIDYLISRN